MSERNQEEQKILEKVERDLNILREDLESTELSILAATRKKEQTQTRLADLEVIKAKLNTVFEVPELPAAQPNN
jgi:hypothetical protein